MKNESSQDQTQFVNESPLYEPLPMDENEVKEPTQLLFSRLSKKQKILLGVGVGLIVIGVTMSVMLSGSQLAPNTNLLPEKAEPRVRLTDLEQRLDELSQELEAADPSQDDLPFPPVDMDLRLDQSR